MQSAVKAPPGWEERFRFLLDGLMSPWLMIQRGISGNNNNLSVEISNGYSATQEQKKIWRHKYKQTHQMECFPNRLDLFVWLGDRKKAKIHQKKKNPR